MSSVISTGKIAYNKDAFVTIEDLYGPTEVIVFENAYVKAGQSLVEENIVIVEGRLSIREDDTTTIIASDIKNFAEEKQKILILDITQASEEQKDKLRGAIRYFNGDKNNINVQIKVGDELKPCGAIYLTDEILKVFQDIIGKEMCKIN